MADQAPPDNSYREAQAEAKAAKARARALRPWYRKKRYLIGIPLAAIILLAIIGGATGGSKNNDKSSNGSTTGAAATTGGSATAAQRQATQEPPRIGTLVQVGSLDLTVEGVERPFDATQYNMFNGANTRVRIRATNARGDSGREYSLSEFVFQVVYNQGVAYRAPGICAGCPDELNTVGLVRGGSFSGSIYFTVPAGRQLVELIYEPLASTNKTRIALR